MAYDNLAAILNALPEQLAPRLYPQWNRTCPTLAAIPAEPGRGRKAAWDVETSGTVGASTSAEGADVADGEVGSDTDQPLVMSWGEYRGAFSLTETEIDAAVSSQGAPDEMLRIFESRVTAKGALIARKINYDLWNEDGLDASTNPCIVGYKYALIASGLYGGVDVGVYTELKANVLANGGTARALTMDLMYQAEANVYTASGESPLIVRTTPGICRKYAGLFEQVRMETGADEYRGGAARLFFRGLPVVRDADAPSGTLVFENTNYCGIKWLPRTGETIRAAEGRQMAAVGKSGNALTGTTIPLSVIPIAKLGTSVKCLVYTKVAFCVYRPNAFAKITDISEA